jgi:hypothetical protein
MTAGGDADPAGLAAVTASVTIGTNADDKQRDGSGGCSATSIRACRRHPNTCCGQICQRRATAETRAPGTRVSAMIRAFSAADAQAPSEPQHAGTQPSSRRH